ncbi:MAG: hypothetical protein RIC55_21905 [Pirellulaceae bacterium]
MARRRRFWFTGDGCGYLLASCVVTCCFLVMNGLLTSAFYLYAKSLGPDWLQNVRVEQLVNFVAPVLMLILEWRLVDMFSDLVAPTSRGKDAEGGEEQTPDT